MAWRNSTFSLSAKIDSLTRENAELRDINKDLEEIALVASRRSAEPQKATRNRSNKVYGFFWVSYVAL